MLLSVWKNGFQVRCEEIAKLTLGKRENKMKLKALVVGVVLATASPFVMAGENVGPYIGGNFGFTSVDTASELQKLANDLVAAGATSAHATMDQKSTGFKVLGGYQVNENLAIEGYYANLGSYKFTLLTTGPALSGSGDIKPTAIGIDVLGILPFSPTQSGFVRVGYFHGESKGNFSVTDGTTTISDSSTTTGSDYKLGLGADWKVSPSLGIRTEWEYYHDKDRPISMLSIGITSHF
jgi:OOP family OmpA-OmpF porin